MDIQIYQTGNSPPTIETKKLFLRPVDINCSQDLYFLFSDKRITNAMGINSMDKIEEVYQWVINTKQEFKLGQSIEWCIYNIKDGQFMGRCGLKNIDHRHKHAELSCAILVKYWKRGVGSESLSSLIHFCFKSLMMHRVEALLYPNNSNMVNLLKKLNFELEGVLKENYFFNGNYGDTAIYALIYR